MDYKEIIEKWLKEYTEMKLQSASSKEAYADLEKSIAEGHAIDYSKEQLSPSHKFNSEVENIAIKLALLGDRIKHLDSKLSVLDEGIEALKLTEKQIIKLKYIDRKRIKYTDQYRNYTWREISEAAGYEQSWCKRLRKSAVEKLAEKMFGK